MGYWLWLKVLGICPMEIIGLDLGASYFKAVELHHEPHRWPKLTLYASAPAPPHPLLSESESDLRSSAAAIRDFLGAYPFTSRAVNIALPESQVFTRVILLPRMSEKEVRQALTWEAEQYIPIPLNDVHIDWQIQNSESKDENRPMEVLLIAAPKSLVRHYLKILQPASLEILGVETETLAAARALVGKDVNTPTTMVVSIGSATTDIGVVSRGYLRFTRSISTGGTALARAVSQTLGFDLEQAEEYKKTYGMDETQLEGKVTEAIKPVFEVIVEEIKRSLAFYTTHHQEEKVKRVILSGGTASLPGIVVYLADSLEVEVQLGNPWSFVEIPAKFSQKELEEIGPSFAVALGLALKEFE